MATQGSFRVRVAYATVALLAVVGILFQVFLVGLSLLGGQPSWNTHVGFGHSFGIFPLVLLGLAFFGRLSGAERRWAGLFFGIYIVQAEVFAAIRDAVPLLAAFHPVLALVLFATSVAVAWRAYTLLRAPAAIGRQAEGAPRGIASYPLAGGAGSGEDTPEGHGNAGR